MVAAHPLNDYSEIANQQINLLETDPDFRRYDEVIKVCNQIFDDPNNIRKFSSTITTIEGVRFSTPVPGSSPYRVFWSMSPEGIARIEAVFTWSSHP